MADPKGLTPLAFPQTTGRSSDSATRPFNGFAFCHAAFFTLHFALKMVGSAGNAPVVASGFIWKTPVLQTGSRDTSRNGSGDGSCTRLNEFMRLASVHWSSSPQFLMAV